MKRGFVIVVLAGCGPTVAMGEGGAEAGFDDSGGSDTTRGGEPTSSATTPMTSSVTLTTSATIDSGDVDDGDPSDDDATDGDPFITPPDIVCLLHCSFDCDQFAQDCPEGEKCMPWANDGGNVWTANKCTPIDRAAVGVGEPCVVVGSYASGVDDCALDAMCFGVDPLTNEGTCVPTCTGDEDEPVCPEGLACTLAFDGYLNVCLTPCDPLAPSCGAGEVCAHAADQPLGTPPFLCYPTPQFEPQPLGVSCGDLRVCDAGLGCVPSEHVPGCLEESCCTLLGDLEAPPECSDPMQECIPVFEGDPPEGLCFCGVPA